MAAISSASPISMSTVALPLPPPMRLQRTSRKSTRTRIRMAADTSPIVWKTVEDYVGQTPLVKLQRLGMGLNNNTILCKLEGNNPAGSVKDRPALSMITEAERAGVIKPGDTLVEATSGNTGIALAMAAAIKGYKLKLIMPSNASAERGASMAAYGAELISVDGGMEDARDLALAMQAQGVGRVLDQFGNPDNPVAHLRTTGPELWEQTQGRITHFVSSMGTTGTIMGTSAYLKAMKPDVQIIGLQPTAGSHVPGIRRWPTEYLPSIFQSWRVDEVMDITQQEAEHTMRVLARTEGIFAGVSSGGAVSAALRLSAQVQDAVIAVIICDRGDRYLSTGVFDPVVSARDPLPCGVEEFWSQVQCLVVGFPGPHWVLFTGQEAGAEDGLWCEESRGVEAAVHDAVRRQREVCGGGTLLVVHVGSEASWMQPDHPLRTHPRVQLRFTPTLMQWQNTPQGVRATRRAAGDLSTLLGLIQSATDSLLAQHRATAAATEPASSSSSSAAAEPSTISDTSNSASQLDHATMGSPGRGDLAAGSEPSAGGPWHTSDSLSRDSHPGPPQPVSRAAQTVGHAGEVHGAVSEEVVGGVMQLLGVQGGAAGQGDAKQAGGGVPHAAVPVEQVPRAQDDSTHH